MQLQLLIFLALFCVAVSQPPGDMCLKDNNVTHAELEALSPNSPVENVAPNIKCYAKCLLRDYIGDDNKLSLERIGDNANAQEKVVLQQCMSQYDDISSTVPCDYGYLLLQCLTLRTEPKRSVEIGYVYNKS
ncbi:uncharacterized protein LOC133848271 [Drosophila sulfurigaster albostrigata]|uniref:uncharacterized protein LOC133848271 n=1 Tax=Drosophila sulfurigaster albostrigata TaxID=89887 RepID=UPI002D21C023|nr:uncharacterized protein LOC133848271 [Drosophila sulfurigaster albostrigata]